MHSYSSDSRNLNETLQKKVEEFRNVVVLRHLQQFMDMPFLVSNKRVFIKFHKAKELINIVKSAKI